MARHWPVRWERGVFGGVGAARLGGRQRRLPAGTRLAMRMAGLAALATGGVVLGRGVVGLSSGQVSPVEVAGASASQADARAALAPDTSALAFQRPQAPAFSSSLRSWALPAAEAEASAPGAAAQPAPAAAATAEPVLYTVAEGDTLSQIAERYAVDVNALASANHLADTNVLLPGARLSIPTTSSTGISVAGVSVAQVTSTPTSVTLPTGTPVPAPAQVPTARPQTSSQAQPAPSAASPDDAVRSFYSYLDQGQFDLAASLWSQHMRATYPPAENIYSRFARTQALTVTRADVVQLDAASGRAVVAVQVSEVLAGSPATARQYVGNWYLVRGPSGWLLDQPSLRQA